MNPNEKVGLVLSGGGARAAYQVGVLKAIYSGKCRAAQGNPPEVFCGTGSGAFNAAVIASRLPGQFPSPIEYLQSLWADEIPREGLSRNNRIFRKRIDILGFLDPVYFWHRPLKAPVQFLSDLGFVGPELIRRTIKALFTFNFSAWLNVAVWHDTSPMFRLITESISLEAIRDGEGTRPQRQLRVAATERGSGQAQIFGNADFTEDVGHSLILGSCALPIIFPPVTIKGKEYMHGGLVMQTPLQPAVEAGCTEIHLIHNDPRGDKPVDGEEVGIRETFNRTVALALNSAVDRDLESRRRINEVLDTLNRAGSDAARYLDPGAGYRRVVVHQYRPKVVFEGKDTVLNFKREHIEKAIALGENDALKHDCKESGCIL